MKSPLIWEGRGERDTPQGCDDAQSKEDRRWSRGGACLQLVGSGSVAYRLSRLSLVIHPRCEHVQCSEFSEKINTLKE